MVSSFSRLTCTDIIVRLVQQTGSPTTVGAGIVVAVTFLHHASKKYLCAQRTPRWATTESLVCDRDKASTWETWTLTFDSSRTQFTISSPCKKFLTMDPDVRHLVHFIALSQGFAGYRRIHGREGDCNTVHVRDSLRREYLV